MSLTKVEVVYQSNYNGCTVLLYKEGVESSIDEFDADDETKVKINAVQDAVINRAYEDVIKEGRYEGEFNGDIDELKQFAIDKAREVFGDVTIVFEEDSLSN